jgi:hypothetical protein
MGTGAESKSFSVQRANLDNSSAAVSAAVRTGVPARRRAGETPPRQPAGCRRYNCWLVALGSRAFEGCFDFLQRFTLRFR